MREGRESLANTYLNMCSKGRDGQPTALRRNRHFCDFRPPWSGGQNPHRMGPTRALFASYTSVVFTNKRSKQILTCSCTYKGISPHTPTQEVRVPGLVPGDLKMVLYPRYTIGWSIYIWARAPAHLHNPQTREEGVAPRARAGEAARSRKGSPHQSHQSAR
jgi:hypothetical protein